MTDIVKAHHLMRSRLLLWFMLLISTSAALAQDNAPEFEAANCPFNKPGGFVIDCGYVTVPESRNLALADATNTVRLAVAVLKSTSARPEADPLIYLDGGPGGHTLDSLEFFAASFDPFLENRDVIFFDQRGVGFSGALDCPAYADLGYDILADDMDFAAVIALSNEALLACRTRLLADGINLAAYTSVESASDVRDLVRALGYEQVNLLGISYGTRLALTIMRDHPTMIRSTIIDAVVPLQANPDSEFLGNINRIFTTLFAGCAQDTACNAQYPNLESVLYDTIDRLNTTPETISSFDFFSGQQRDILINGDVLISTLFSLFYRTNEIPNLPRYIYNARDGDYEPFVEDLLFALFQSDFFDEGMFTAVRCNEETPFDQFDAALASRGAIPEQLSSIILTQTEGQFELCAAWVDPIIEPVDNAPVVSDIPTLITVGEYDPITPPRWAQQAAETLSNNFLYVFPGVGHAAFSSSPCATDIMLSFVNNPADIPDSACITNIAPPLFATATINTISNRPYIQAELGFTSLVPENWFEVEPGMFSPYPAMELPIPVIAYRFPTSIDDYVSRIIVNGFYAYDALPDPIDRFQLNGRVWTLYQIERPDQAVYTSFAFSESDTPYVIGVTATTPEERDYLFDALLIPAIETFRISG